MTSSVRFHNYILANVYKTCTFLHRMMSIPKNVNSTEQLITNMQKNLD